MLLAPSFFPSTTQHHSAFSPLRPSPLSERSANAVPRLFNFTMAPQSNEKKATPQRVYKPNPAIQTRDAASKRRRDMFFRRVQNDRDDKQWAQRGEQIQHLDYVSERRRWEEEKARQAPPEIEIFDDELIENEDLPEMPREASPEREEESEADRYAAQEEYELQQLISSIEQHSDARSQHYGSDDDDYDSIFMECATTEDPSCQGQKDSWSYDADAMDVDFMIG